MKSSLEPTSSQVQKSQEGLEEWQKTTLTIFSTDARCLALSDVNKECIHAANAFPVFHNIAGEKQEDAIRRMLAIIVVKVGIKEKVPAANINVIVAHFRKWYRTMTLEEVLLGIDLNLNGEFEQRIEHFNSLDVDYLTKIVNSYKGRKEQAFKEFAKIKANKSEEIKSVTDKEAYEGLLNYREKNKSWPLSWNWSRAFGYWYGLEIRKGGDKEVHQPIVDKKIKDWMLTQKQKYLAEINKKIASALTLVERQILELEKSEDSVSLHLRKEFLINHLK